MIYELCKILSAFIWVSTSKSDEWCRHYSTFAVQGTVLTLFAATVRWKEELRHVCWQAVCQNPLSHTKPVNTFSFPLFHDGKVTGVVNSHLIVYNGMPLTVNLCETCKTCETGYAIFQFVKVGVRVCRLTVKQFEYSDSDCTQCTVLLKETMLCWNEWPTSRPRERSSAGYLFSDWVQSAHSAL